MEKLIILILLSNLLTSCKEPEEKLPNIVFILADDMGYGDPGCYNPDSKIPTPNINDLANHGIMFTDAHSPGAWCVPSRLGLMTGRYPGRVKLNWTERALIDDNQETLASLLKKMAILQVLLESGIWDSIISTGKILKK